MLKAGDHAPDFTATIQTGETVSLQDFRGQKLILFIWMIQNLNCYQKLIILLIK
jgi:peroxiredoxin Q/BCP